jgi:DNA polymerase-3 subunit delta
MSVHLVRGNDPVLREDAVSALVRELLGDDDRMLALEDVEIPGRSGEGEVGGTEARAAALDAALSAASTAPFMTTHRVVVVREIGNLTKDEAAPLVAYVGDPVPTTQLVLVVGGGTVAKVLEDRLKRDVSVTGPDSEKASEVLARHLDGAGVTLRGDAAAALLTHVGNDAGLVPGLVDTLTSAFGAGAPALTLDEVAPHLVGEGMVPVWDLTNAIEKGDAATALQVLQRLLTVTSPTQPKSMHPLQVLGMLHGQYRRLLRLDDPEIRTNEDAAAALGGRTNPRAAGFRLRQARALGTDGLRQAFDHLARADLDLKGDRAIPSEAVLEILVVRLAALSARTGGRR